MKGSWLFAVFLLLPIIPAVMGALNYNQFPDVLEDGWYSLWTQVTIFYGNFFYAPLIALYAAYLWRLEHLNHNWNVLMTEPVPVWAVFCAKLAQAVKVAALTQLWVGVLFYVCGRLLCGLSGAVPAQIAVWLVRGLFGGVVVAAVQTFLSMEIRSFSVPIVIALCGSVAGFLFVSKGWGLYFPYSLMVMGMNANREEDIMAGGTVGFAVSAGIFLTVFLCLGVMALRRDVKA